MRIKTLVVAAAITSATALLVPSNLHALASFARQTGLTCSACHLSFPELTPTGRDFKLNAFTTTAEDKVITEEGNAKTSALSILDDLPLSVNVQASMTYTNKSQTNSQNPSVEFPQQINLLLAGQITPHFGTFLQLTYLESTDSLNGDSSEVRFVATKTKLAGENRGPRRPPAWPGRRQSGGVPDIQRSELELRWQRTKCVRQQYALRLSLVQLLSLRGSLRSAGRASSCSRAALKAGSSPRSNPHFKDTVACDHLQSPFLQSPAVSRAGTGVE